MSPGFSIKRGKKERGTSPPPRSGGGDVPLPCLYSNNSIEVERAWNKLQPGHKRSAYVLACEIQHLAKFYSLERLGFLTLTFRDHVTDIREAQRRFNSLNTNVLKKRYLRAIVVWEEMVNGRIHFHLVVVLPLDIRTGFNFEAIRRQDYRSANAAIRAEWAFWRLTAPKYGFGRTELLPVKSTAEGIARYVGKYISKHVGQRTEKNKGARMVRYIGFGRVGRTAGVKFAWNSDASWLWRQKLAVFADRHGILEYNGLKKRLGNRWAYRYQALILGQSLSPGVVYPSVACGLKESEKALRLEVAIASRDFSVKGALQKPQFLEAALEKYHARNDTGGGICAKRLVMNAERVTKVSRHPLNASASDNDEPLSLPAPTPAEPIRFANFSIGGKPIPQFTRVRHYDSDAGQWVTTLIPEKVEQPF